MDRALPAGGISIANERLDRDSSSTPAAYGQLNPAKRERFSWAGLFGFPRLALAGGLAMLLVISVLLVDNVHLRNKVSQTAAERNALRKRENDLRVQLNNQLASNATLPNHSPALALSSSEKNTRSIEKHAAPQMSSLPVSVTAFMLAPQMRGATQIPDLSLPLGTTQATFQLDLESNDFPRYLATLINVKSEKALWHSVSLKPITKGESSVVIAAVPAKLLQPAIYQLDLTGVSSNGEPEFVSSYVFRIETR